MADDPNNGTSDRETEAEHLRKTEQDRLRALVSGDMDRAQELHADDFQLINPAGGSLSKETYLGMIASGELNYIVWKPGAIAVRMNDDAAVIRYRSELEAVVAGEPTPRNQYWHTDLYEKRAGRWQVVWSQATRIRE